MAINSMAPLAARDHIRLAENMGPQTPKGLVITDPFILMCKLKLDQHDKAIQQFLNEQQVVMDKKSILSDALQTLDNYTGGANSEGERNAAINALETAAKKLEQPPYNDFNAAAKLREKEAPIGADGSQQGGHIEGARQTIKTEMARMDTTVELDTMALKSEMEKRGATVSMFSGIVESLEKTASKLADRIGT